MPKVSVLMPTYNTSERQLREAVDSILAQSFTDFEFLILDDGSRNNVKDVILSYSDPRICFWENEQNLGISATRNKLIDRAKGKYLAVVDHDDISMPNRLAAQVEFLDLHPDVGVVGSSIERLPSGKVAKYPEHNRKIEELLMYDCIIEHPAAMIRKSVLLENNLRYEQEFSPSEDYALWVRLLGKTKFANIPAILLRYRSHRQNTTHVQGKKMRDTSRDIRLLARAAHPDIWMRAEQSVEREGKYKLFGLITLMTVRKKGKTTRYYLFGFIPMAESRWREVIFN